MAAFRYEVSFRVTHPARTADEIATGLGMTPRHSWNVGARRVTPKGTALEGIRDRSYCTFRMMEGDDGQVAKAIVAALDQLQKKYQYLRDLRECGGRFDFFIYWEADGMAGETFPPDLLSKLGELGIELQLDIYGPHCGPEATWDCKERQNCHGGPRARHPWRGKPRHARRWRIDIGASGSLTLDGRDKPCHDNKGDKGAATKADDLTSLNLSQAHFVYGTTCIIVRPHQGERTRVRRSVVQAR